MKKTLGTLLTATIFLALTIGCNEKKTITATPIAEAETTMQTDVISPEDANRFRITHPEQVGSITVICHNCQAQFKLSPKLQKMSMKGDAIIPCPVCHKNYLGEHK